MSGPTIRSRFRPQRARRRAVEAPQAAQKAPESRQQAAPSRAARMLALAHHIERLVEAGELSGYAEAARALGLTRARLTQVMKLLLLAPEVQERVVQGRPELTERELRKVGGEPTWYSQELKLAQSRGSFRPDPMGISLDRSAPVA